MAEWNGRSWKGEELRRRVGEMGQLAGIDRLVLDDGHERGTRAALLRTGSGLEAEVLLDRAMDLGRVWYQGLPLAFRAPVGSAHPAFYDAQGAGWLKVFGGGLLTTCGLQNVGSGCEDEGLAHGVHGGLSATPASEVATQAEWRGDRYLLTIKGKVREVPALGFFGPQLVLQRTIATELGANRITISDEVTNQGFSDSGFMLLYHINAGFPVVDEGARLLAPSLSVEPRDAEARKGLEQWSRCEGPTPGYAEQVFFHRMRPDANGLVRVALVPPRRPGGGRVGLCVTYHAAELPEFIEWKMVGEGNYVVGLEPANCLVRGRKAERERGTLQVLKPGQTRKLMLELGVLSDEREIEALEQEAGRRAKG